jgi:putative copper export protein
LSEIVALLLRANRLTQSLQGGGLDPQLLLQIITTTLYGWLWLARIALLLLALILHHWPRRVKKVTPVPEPSSSSITRANTGQARITIDLRTSSTTSRLSKEQIQQEQITPEPVPAPHHTRAWLFVAGAILATYVPSDGITQVLQPYFSAILFSWLRFATQGVWFGGIAYLGYVLLPLKPTVASDHHAESLATLLRRLTPFLLTSMGITLASSFFLDEASIGDIQQFITDSYGRILLVQIALTVLLLFLSLYIFLSLCPRLTRQALLLPVVDAEQPARRTRKSAMGHAERRLKALAKMHTWLAGAVLLCAALLAFFAPPIVYPNVTYNNPAASGSLSTMQTKQLGDLAVTLQVLPGHSDAANTVVLSILDSRGTPVTDAQIQLSTNMLVMDMGTTQATARGGNPLYIVPFSRGQAFSMAGLWNINVRIERPGHDPVQGAFQIMLTQ